MTPSLSKNDPVFSVSIAAQMAGMHAQTVRQYDRLGLVVASRTKGGGRRYSLADIEELQEIQTLSQEEGINLAGISRILELEKQVAKLKRENNRLNALAERLKGVLYDKQAQERRVFAAGQDGNIITLARGERAPSEGTRRSSALVIWRPSL
ncbi:heat shock protein transcriptional repressor HspR [Flaviflexus massiliensis]|uniref:heat shock protein transcriptional repressor HspR n=1 Tax=Flaviflexus massiliensis TaxID=1522309 RepID=UPI0006D561F3|nr:helix-turn-helix transcriptional regulator [Flaviflexus massiliensis]